MATLYIDFENGNDTYGGTSFSLLASGTDGRITSTTFSSATANFPNDGSLINQYLSIFNGTIYAVYNITAWVSSTSLTIAALSGGTALANQAVDRQYFIGGRWQTLTNGATAVRIIPGDTIRVRASPDPTSLGINGTWTSSPLQPTRAISSSTNASPIVITANNHGYSNGNTVVITGHTTNTNANGTWEIANVTTNTFSLVNSTGNGVGGATGTVRLRNNSVVKLASAVTQNIASCGNRGEGRTAWTNATNVVTSLNTTTFKEGDCSDSIAINATFTTGLAAYKNTETLNLSGYQQISFWITQTAGTVAIDGDISLRLCSDTLGATTVHTVNIPALGALNVWNPVTIDLGTNLNSSIQSIALYVDTDRGAQTFLLSNIIACKASSSADSLSLISLIGKNTGTEPWVAIQSINGTRVFLDGLVSHGPTTTTLMGYIGTSESVTTWKRETIFISSTQSLNEAGTTNRFVLSGGWDRTSMSSQNSHSYLDFRRGNIIAFTLSASFWNINKLNIFRSNVGFQMGNNISAIEISDCENMNHNSNLFTPHGTLNIFSSITISNISNLNYNSSIITTNSFSLGFDNFTFSNIININSNSSSVFAIPTAITVQLASFNTWNIQNITNINNNGATVFSMSDSTALARAFDNLNFQNITNINNNLGNCFVFNEGNRILFNNITNINNNTASSFALTNVSMSTISNIQNISGSLGNHIALSNCENTKIININNIVGATTSISNLNSLNNTFINVNTSGTTVSISIDAGKTFCKNCTFNEPSTVSFATSQQGSQIADGTLYIESKNNNVNNNEILMFGGRIFSNTNIRYGSSGYSWALAPTSTNRTSSYPLSFTIAKQYVVANKLVTVKAFARRTNTALTVRLRIAGGSVLGVSSDISSSATSNITNIWEELTLTFTPTSNGVVEILGEAFGGTTHTGYIDNVRILQES